MAETDVEIILREIRERVLAEQRSVKTSELTSPGDALDNGNHPTGLTMASESEAAEKLAVINSYLVTLARAWDRLPPVVSNRSGLSAQIELWLKRHLKRATRWYAWEQVNFNANVHLAIRDILVVLTDYQQELERLRAHQAAHEAARQADFEKQQSEIDTQRAELEIQRRALETQRAALDAQSNAQRTEMNTRLNALLNELGERITFVQEEQRVAFKQLALETSEAAVLEDRARRKTEALIEELKKKVMSKGDE